MTDSIVICVTVEELKNWVYDVADNSRPYFESRNPNLFKDFIRIYVPIHEGWEKVISGNIPAHRTNSVRIIDDKVIFHIHDTMHVWCCYIDETEKDSMVLTINPNFENTSIALVSDVKESPKWDGTSPTLYSKTFQNPTIFDSEESKNSALEIWDALYDPMFCLGFSKRSDKHS